MRRGGERGKGEGDDGGGGHNWGRAGGESTGELSGGRMEGRISGGKGGMWKGRNNSELCYKRLWQRESEFTLLDLRSI